MKTPPLRSFLRFAALAVLLSTLNPQLSTFAQGTMFSYEGHLSLGGKPASGPYDFVFTLYDARGVTGRPQAMGAVSVNNGLFNVDLDFGDAFNGAPRWLEIQVKPASSGTYTALRPLQPILPTPYAIMAGSSSNLLGVLPTSKLSGTLDSAQLGGIYSGAVVLNSLFNSFSGDGTRLGLDASNLTNGVIPDARFSENVALLHRSPQTFFGQNNFVGSLGVTNNSFAGGITLHNGGNPAAFYIYDSLGERAAFAFADGPGAYSADARAGDIILRALNGKLLLQTGSGVAALAISTNNNIGIGGVPAENFKLHVVGDVRLEDRLIAWGDLITEGNLKLYTSSGRGVIYMDSEPFIHGYGVDNFFAGRAGNFTMSGGFNTGVGYKALLSNTNGGDNTAIGGDALLSNTSGSENTANGVFALLNNTTGSRNTATGVGALGNNRSGSYNTADGVDALSQNTAGDYNIALGYLAGSSITTGTNNICIGNSGVAGESAAIRIGTTQTAAFIAGVFGKTVPGVPVYIDPSGHLGTSPSSARFKQNIKDMGEASHGLLALRPVTFRYKPELDPKGAAQFGLVAEEVAKINPDLVARDDKDQIYTVRYEAVNAMLLNEFLKQHRALQELKSTVQTQNARNTELERRVEALERILQKN